MKFRTYGAFGVVVIIVLFMLFKIAEPPASKEKLEFPITAQKALEIVKNNKNASVFVDRYMKNESNRIIRINLNYNLSSRDYIWNIELIEKECGCKFGSEKGLNLIIAEIDPTSGKILTLDMQVGIKESEIAKERCMEGCHSRNNTKSGFIMKK